MRSNTVVPVIRDKAGGTPFLIWRTCRWCVRQMPAIAGMMVLALMSAGCNLSDGGMSPYRPPDQYFAVLALKHHAINLSMVAPYDTVTVHTVREMGNGSVVPGDVTYSVSSPNLSIADGVLKAEGPVTRAVLRVTLTHGTITRTDSAIVSVIAAAPNLLRDFGMRVTENDSAKAGAEASSKTIPLVRTSVSGSNLSALLVSVVSSDSTVAVVTQSGNTVRVTPKRPGRVELLTSTYAFGAEWRDSLIFTVGWPTRFLLPIVESFRLESLTSVLGFQYRDVTIGMGGCVIWQTKSTTADVDLVFDDPSHVEAPSGHPCAAQVYDPTIGGDIEPFRALLWERPLPTNEEELEDYWKVFFSAYRARVFSTPGIYLYRSTLHGTTGKVRVCNERSDTTCAPPGMGAWL